MRTGIALGIGFLVGVGAGFLLFRDDAGPERPGRREAPRPAAPAALREAELSTAPAAPRRRGPVVVRTNGGNVTTTGGLVIIDQGEVVESRESGDVEAELARARAAGDWDAYWRVVLELAALGTPEAQAQLVAVMGDATLNLQGAWSGQVFYRALKDSDVPGIFEAARTRAEIDLAEHPDLRWRGVGWLSLVALHGGEGELDWIQTQGTNRNWEMEVDRALADGARNPLAAQRLAERIADPRHFLFMPVLGAFARENPRAAFDTAARALPGAGDRQRVLLWRLLGEAATEETLPAARALMERLEGESARLAALNALDRIAKRKLPVAGFEPVLDLPRRILAEYSTRGVDPKSSADAQRLRRTLGAVEAHEITWNEETLLLVKGLAARVDGDLASYAGEIAKRMEAGLRGDDNGWQPERGER